MAIWSRLFSGIFGVGVGIAAADAVQPVVEVARQEAWKGNANRVLGVGELAALLAQGLVEAGLASDHARRNGYDSDKLDALAQLALTAPGIPQALHMWRLGEIEWPLVEHALRKASLEPQYDAAVKAQRTLPLDPAILAYAIVRGVIPDPGILPVSPPTGVGRVPKFPVFDIDAVKEALAAAVDRDHLAVMVANAGRPMSPEAAALAVFKGIIDRIDFERAVAEGDTRNEWADAIFENSRFVVSPQDAAGLRLRGWKTKAEAEELGALHGASPETMELLYLNRGRPAAPAQMATAAVRGIDGPDGRPMDEAQFLKGIRESDIRPEWGPMLWRSRFLYPSLFQLNRLVTSGAIPPATGAEWATKARYAPEVVEALLRSWTGAGTAAATPWANRAQSRLYTTAHAEYLAYSLDEAGARKALASIGAVGAEQDAVLGFWTAERAINRTELTPAQVKKAYRASLYTEAEALAELAERGYSDADARTLLTE